MQTTDRTIETALQRLEETIEAKKGAELPPLAERKRLRVAAGLSARELAEVIGVKNSTIHVWESRERLPVNGNSRVYSAVLDRLAEVAS